MASGSMRDDVYSRSSDLPWTRPRRSSSPSRGGTMQHKVDLDELARRLESVVASWRTTVRVGPFTWPGRPVRGTVRGSLLERLDRFGTAGPSLPLDRGLTA